MTKNVTYKVRAGDDGTYRKVGSWLEAMQAKDAFASRGFGCHILALRNNGNDFVGLRKYRSDGTYTQEGSFVLTPKPRSARSARSAAPLAPLFPTLFQMDARKES